MKQTVRTQVAIFAIFWTLTVGGCFLLGSSPAELAVMQDRLDRMERQRSQIATAEQRITTDAATARAAGNTAEAERLEKIAAEYKAELERITEAEAIAQTELDAKKKDAAKSDQLTDGAATILGLAGFGSIATVLVKGRKLIQTLKYQYEQRQLFDIATVEAIEEFRQEVPPEISEKIKSKLMKSHQARGVGELAKKIVNRME